MEAIQPGDNVSPVTAMGVTAVHEVAGIVLRLRSISATDQPLEQAQQSPNYILQSAQARQLGESLLKAAELIERVAAANQSDA